MGVHSGSMEPAFQRGDILFLNNWVRVAVVSLFASCSLRFPPRSTRVSMLAMQLTELRIDLCPVRRFRRVLAGLSRAPVQSWGHCSLQTGGA